MPSILWLAPWENRYYHWTFMYLQTLCRNSCGTNVLLFFSIFLLDEYILPKIAERNLRRFAILQSSSVEVGVNLPLHKVPFFLSLQVICWLLSSSLALTHNHVLTLARTWTCLNSSAAAGAREVPGVWNHKDSQSTGARMFWSLVELSRRVRDVHCSCRSCRKVMLIIKVWPSLTHLLKPGEKVD